MVAQTNHVQSFYSSGSSSDIPQIQDGRVRSYIIGQDHLEHSRGEAEGAPSSELGAPRVPHRDLPREVSPASTQRPAVPPKDSPNTSDRRRRNSLERARAFDAGHGSNVMAPPEPMVPLAPQSSTSSEHLALRPIEQHPDWNPETGTISRPPGPGKRVKRAAQEAMEKVNNKARQIKEDCTIL